jgi:peptidoglycan/xylan/chitin deacetylase (PgdA/CDA1 family)
MWRDFQVVRDAPEPARRRWRVPLGWVAAGLAIVGLCAGALSPQSNLFGMTYWHGPSEDKIVALSFDDGPNEPYTSQVLDILKREHVRATFFLIGENVRHFPDTAARIVREGHVVGNHTDHHPMPFALRPTSTLQSEVSNAEVTIRNATGQYAHLFRPPNGLRSPWLIQVLERDSLLAVNWDDAPGDWDPLPVQTIVDRAVGRARPGSIILLHDGLNLLHGADQGATVRALPAIIDELRARGYRFVTVPELLRCPATLSTWPPKEPRRSV